MVETDELAGGGLVDGEVDAGGTVMGANGVVVGRIALVVDGAVGEVVESQFMPTPTHIDRPKASLTAGNDNVDEDGSSLDVGVGVTA